MLKKNRGLKWEMGAEPSNMNPGKMEMETGNEAARGSLGGGFRGEGGGALGRYGGVVIRG